MKSKLDPRGWLDFSKKENQKPANRHIPIMELHHEIDRLFDDFFSYFELEPKENVSKVKTQALHPKINISETKTSYEVDVEIPGVDIKDTSVEYINGALVVSAEKKSEVDDKNKNYRRVECIYGRFKRAIPLPEDIDPAHISAKYNNGVLKIAIKRQKTRNIKHVKITVEK